MEFRSERLTGAHTKRGHPGWRLAFDRLASHWWWPVAHTAVREALNKCVVSRTHGGWGCGERHRNPGCASADSDCRYAGGALAYELASLRAGKPARCGCQW